MPRPRKDATQKRKTISIKLPPWLIAWLREQNKSQSALIEEALIEKHNLNKCLRTGCMLKPPCPDCGASLVDYKG